MAWDSWYELAIRELSERSDPAREKLAEAVEALPELPGFVEDENEEEVEEEEEEEAPAHR
jgi:hypothetical protein